MHYLFWISMWIIVYIYIGYPILLLLGSKLFPKKHKVEDSFRPTVTILVSAYNEQDVIENKIKNLIALEYPKDKITSIICSDCSDDNTDKIVRSYDIEGIKLIRQKMRLGKTACLNKAIPEIDSEIIVFSDANSIYESDTIKRLVSNFVDKKIGYVVGQQLYNTTKRKKSTEINYWEYEVKIKMWESKIGSVVGGDGAIYAIRKSLFFPLDIDDINDFVNPLHIILQGYRGIFCREAICYEDVAVTYDEEFRRKRRIVNRSWRALWKNMAVMNPFYSGIFSWQIISHKLLRWVGGLIGLFLFISNTFLINNGMFFQLVLAGQCGFYLIVFLGYILNKLNKNIPSIVGIPYYFFMVNLNSLRGIWDAFSGRTYTTWQTIREGN